MLELQPGGNVFTPAEESYLKSQLLARLATVAPDGTVQNSPVGFFFNDELKTFDIWGQRMGRTKKFANVTSYPRVALVIDDLASVNPWIARGIEIRGLAEPLSDLEPPRPYYSREVIRIHPFKIITWGLEEGGAYTSRRIGSSSQAKGAPA
jgi:pyridoxamine 5'-phosphate oxidase family protein